MLGENFYGPRAMHEAIRAQACDLVMPDLMRIGGVSGWLQAAAIADTAGSPMSSHLYPEVSGHLLRVTPTRPTHSRSDPASCTCPMSRATAWIGTKALLRTTRWNADHPGHAPRSRSHRPSAGLAA